ncbi:unnamed protein product [Alternaria alternata]
MPYETAYIGIATTPSGGFDHFVRQLKTSHLAGGYWRFQSTDDDRRAYARGFTTPEDVLCAAESTSEGFDEIFIRWIRGANDPNIRMALSGTPSQHLQTIYELRLLLGLPVSSRGQIPLYPISTKPRLRQYWEDKYRAQRPDIIDTASQLPDQPIASPVTPRLETLVSPQPQHPVQATPKSPVGRITRARSKEISQAARATPAAKTTSIQHPLNAITEHLTQSPAARALSREVAVSSLPSSKVSRNQVTPRDNSSLVSTSISPAPSADIQPMQNLTMLDYRILTEAVNKFDPGPWTTHFETHPEPEVEDAETQIRGIAEVIRNEDSYKMDKELHNLSDEFMIMLWAFKTSDKVRVIDEYVGEDY